MSYRILYYNWAPYFQKKLEGGGVSIYCRNLIDYLAQSKDYQINFIYSGFDYSYFPKQPYLRKIYNKRHPQVETFSIVNSPIPAPSSLSFDNPLGNVKNLQLEKCFEQLLTEQQPYDIIHFHNLEGLTANCLKLAKESGAKVVFSLHNYWSICPRVDLWKLENSACDDYFDGRACVACLPSPYKLDMELSYRRMSHLGSLIGLDEQSTLLRLPKKLYYVWFKGWNWLKPTKSPLIQPLNITGTELSQEADLYRHRRQEIVSLINRYVDVALSVSERTTSIYQQYGIDPVRLKTQYIGSKATEFQAPANNPTSYSVGQPFRLIYMGPARAEKGFDFLLEHLRCLTQEELRSLDLVVAAKITDGSELKMATHNRGRLLSLAQSLHSLRYSPGYTYENIPSILDGVHLGVVPPLWEDNMPQVTLELLACRVPVLCSNRGGAQEYVRHPAFIFDPDKEGDFQSKLRTIRENPHLLSEFWKEARPVKSLNQHFEELTEIYQSSYIKAEKAESVMSS